MSNYEYASIPTIYRAVEFRSRLEARWAAYADLSGWKWEYEPIDLKGWIPDFLFRLPCGHSDCCGVAATHCPDCRAPLTEIVVEPHTYDYSWLDCPPETRLAPTGARCHGCGKIYPHWIYLDDFHHELYAEVKPYRTLEEFDGHKVCDYFDNWTEPVGAKFGYSPEVSAFQITHGSGGGIYDALNWGGTMEHWIEAGNLVQWKGEKALP